MIVIVKDFRSKMKSEYKQELIFIMYMFLFKMNACMRTCIFLFGKWKSMTHISHTEKIYDVQYYAGKI